MHTLQKTCHQVGKPCLALVIHLYRKLKDKQTKLRFVSSGRSVYLQYDHVKVGVQVVYYYSLVVYQVSTLFLQDLSISTKKLRHPLRDDKNCQHN